ncbi:MAG: branched-chain amino acid aminotransferase [Sphingomonadales bacterium]
MSTPSFDDRDGLIWMDGQMVPWRESKVHVLTHAMHYGSAVFEGQRAYDGEVFKLEEHTSRLFESARLLDYEIPWEEEAINQACKDVLKANNLTNAYMRPIAWRGSEQMGVSAQATKIHVGIAAWEWPSYFTTESRMKGLNVTIAKWKRPDPETAPAKSKAAGLYMICTMSKHAAENNGFDDAMMFDWQGRVAELTGANVFFVKGNEIHTPIADCFLDGITRRTAMELARQRGFEIVERRILPPVMEDFEQAFVTGTAAEVTPLRQIGDYNFEVGAICKQLMQDYDDLVHRRQVG